jgi:hypothetical protein
MEKSGKIHLSIGLTIRIISSIIIMTSLPFLVLQPANPIAQLIFAFGNFLLVIGANVE